MRLEEDDGAKVSPGVCRTPCQGNVRISCSRPEINPERRSWHVRQSMWPITFLLLPILLVCTTAQQLAGDHCTLPLNEPGVCKPFRQCQSAMTMLTQGTQPQICSFIRDVPIVCCKREGIPPTRPITNKPGSQRPGTNNPYNWPDFNQRPTHGTSSKPRPTQSGFASSKPRPTQSGFASSKPRPIHSGGGSSRPKRRISEAKCEEYSELVTDHVQGLPLVIEPDPVSLSVANCPDAGLRLIVGGEETEPGEFPHMAAIGYQRRDSEGFDWNCGGSLISESFVLTAAHCTRSHWGAPAIVRLGVWNLRRKTADGSYFHQPGYLGTREGASSGDYEISRIIKHPNYRPPAKYNDIALLKLKNPVRQFTQLVRPACLNSNSLINVNKATATGWGRIDFAEDPSDVLLKVSLSIIDANTCNQLYLADQKSNKLPQGIVGTMMCAGELRGGKDTCKGDSGGPIEIQSQNNNCIHHIVGVTSFGKLCAAPNAPGVYTRVSSYVPWIESIVWPSG